MNPAPPAEAAAILRTNSLAIAFQDVVTVILRVRYRVQPVSDVNAFRDSMRRMIGSSTQEARRLGYSDAVSQTALYAVVAFLDESVLNSQDPAFGDWARRPLGEEMFGGHFAGEYFFRHVADLLQQQDTQEGADALELHALCLLLGYRGKLAFADGSESDVLIRRIREKIARTRGPMVLGRTQTEEPAVLAAPRDPWVRRLVFTAVALAVLVVAAFALFTVLLGNQLGSVQTAATATFLPSPALALAFRSFSL